MCFRHPSSFIPEQFRKIRRYLFAADCLSDQRSELIPSFMYHDSLHGDVLMWDLFQDGASKTVEIQLSPEVVEVDERGDLKRRRRRGDEYEPTR